MNIVESLSNALAENGWPKKFIRPWTILQPFKKANRGECIINAVDWVFLVFFVIH